MRIGITGHQNLGDEGSVSWIRESICQALTSDNASSGYSCLAIGADKVFVGVFHQRGLPFIAVIPCALYEQTFKTAEDVASYHLILSQAKEVIRLPFTKPSEEAFMAGGTKIVDCCDKLYAAWNGKPAKGLGGTADVVRYAQENGKRVLHMNPLDRSIQLL